MITLPNCVGMRKYLLFLGSILVSQVCLATDFGNVDVMGKVVTNRMDVSTVGKVSSIGFIDGSSQTTSGALRGKQGGVFVMYTSTIDCGAGLTCTDGGNGVFVLTGSGGGGGGGSGLTYFTGSQFVSVSTAAFINIPALSGGGMTSYYFERSTATVTGSWTFGSSVTVNGIGAGRINFTVPIGTSSFENIIASRIAMASFGKVELATHAGSGGDLSLSWGKNFTGINSDNFAQSIDFWVGNTTNLSLTGGAVNALGTQFNATYTGVPTSPLYAFSSDGNGLYFPGTFNNYNVGVAVKGLERVRFTTTGTRFGAIGPPVQARVHIGTGTDIDLLVSSEVPKFQVTGSSILANTEVWITSQTTIVSTLTIQNPYGLSVGTMLAVNAGSGFIGMGTANPTDSLHILSDVNASLRFQGFGADGSVDVRNVYQRANGSQGSPSVVSDADKLVRFVSQGYDGAVYRTAGEMDVKVDGTPGSSDMPGRFEFATTADGAATPTIRFVIKNNGNAGFGSSIIPSSRLDVEGGSVTIRGSGSGLRVSGLASQPCVGTDSEGNFGAGTCSGGGGGSGAVWLYTGAANTTVSTFTVAGAKFASGSGFSTITVLFDGVLSASHTGVNFWGSTRALASFFSASLTTSNVLTDLLLTFTSTSDARGNTFVNFRSTTDSSLTAFVNFRSTTDSSLTSFVNFFSTANSRWEAHKSTADVMDANFTAWFSTYQTRSNSVLSSTQIIDGIQLRLATSTLVGIDEGTTLSGGNLSAINCVGSAITCTQSGSSMTVTISASGGGGGVANVFTFDGSLNTAYSTITLQTPFGNAPVATSGISSFTVLGVTNPYRTLSIPLVSCIGAGVSSASWTNGGIAISSGRPTWPWDQLFPDAWHEFNTSTYSFLVCPSFRMPFEYSGGSIAFQVSWYASTGQANTNTVWSIGAVAITSGTSAVPTFVSSASVVSTWISSNTEIVTPPVAFNIEGTPRPGTKVKPWLTVSGGDGRDTFLGVPKATELMISYPVNVWDGKNR